MEYSVDNALTTKKNLITLSLFQISYPSSFRVSCKIVRIEIKFPLRDKLLELPHRKIQFIIDQYDLQTCETQRENLRETIFGVQQFILIVSSILQFNFIRQFNCEKIKKLILIDRETAKKWENFPCEN